MSRKQKQVKKKGQPKSLQQTNGGWKMPSLSPWVVVVLTIVLTASIRLRLLNIPLERDEGEFAYMGQLLLQGIPPYLMAYNMKLPGIYAAYAFLMSIFGQTAAGIHLGLMMVNGCTIVLVFLLVRKILDPRAGAVAAATFGILSLSAHVLGTSAHATHFVILFAVSGILLMLKALEKDRLIVLFLSGLLMGMAFMMKQHGVFFIIFSILYLVVSQMGTGEKAWGKYLTQHAVFIAGTVLPFILSCLILWKAGVFDKFWFWTYTYASAYATRIPLSDGIMILLGQAYTVMKPAWPIWLLAAAGLASLIWNEQSRRKSFFIAGFTIFSFLAICPGLYFREHYFILLLPAISLLTGVAINSIHSFFLQSKRQWIAVFIFILAVGYSVYQEHEFIFTLTPHEASRWMYGVNPFPESIVIADYIKNHTTKNDRIAVIGSEPQIYFYAHRLSSTGHIYMYGLMENHPHARNMQLELIREVESGKPKFLIFIDVNMSWLANQGSEQLIFDWFEDYTSKYYKTAGIVTIHPQGQTEYLWGQDTVNHQPNSQATIYIFERLIGRAAIEHFKEVLHSKAQRDSSRKHQYIINNSSS